MHKTVLLTEGWVSSVSWIQLVLNVYECASVFICKLKCDGNTGYLECVMLGNGCLTEVCFVQLFVFGYLPLWYHTHTRTQAHFTHTYHSKLPWTVNNTMWSQRESGAEQSPTNVETWFEFSAVVPSSFLMLCSCVGSCWRINSMSLLCICLLVEVLAEGGRPQGDSLNLYNNCVLMVKLLASRWKEQTGDRMCMRENTLLSRAFPRTTAKLTLTRSECRSIGMKKERDNLMQ